MSEVPRLEDPGGVAEDEIVGPTCRSLANQYANNGVKIGPSFCTKMSTTYIRFANNDNISVRHTGFPHTLCEDPAFFENGDHSSEGR